MDDILILENLCTGISSDTIASKTAVVLRMPPADHKIAMLAASGLSVAAPAALYSFHIPPSSELLSRLPEELRTVSLFPFILTVGREASEWAASFNDIAEQLYASEILNCILSSALDALACSAASAAGTGPLFELCPGTVPLPLSLQADLFAFFGPRAGDLGVRLNSSFMIEPAFSVAGFFCDEARAQGCRNCSVRSCMEAGGRCWRSTLEC